MEKKEKPNEIKKASKYIIDIISAGINGDKHKVELSALTLSRFLKANNPEISVEINEIISTHTLLGSNATRGNDWTLPVDNDSQLEMVNIITPDKNMIRPVFNKEINERIDTLLDERKNASILLGEGIRPTNSLLLVGEPGTGKTMLAKYLASALDKKLIVLDLSSSISSLLGKTGSNLKKVLNFAKDSTAILLLDEFDAIAKKRDDMTDLGEIKRVVNVLLMELDHWPVSSMVIATTNHPELLDRAIWRRFDHTIETTLPDKEKRKIILQNELSVFFKEGDNSDKFFNLITEVLNDKTPAELSKFSNNVKRRIILKKDDITFTVLTELANNITDKKERANLCFLAKKYLGDSITVRDLSLITGLSLGGVQHHIQKLNNHEQ